MRGKLALTSLATLVLAAAACADVSYVSWDSTHATSTSASGTIDLGGGQTIGVTISGPLSFVQGSSGNYYWNPNSTYEGTGVPNAPSTADLVAITGGGTSSYTVTFDHPVFDLVMPIVSLGAPGTPVDYNFDHSFTLVNTGPGAFGGAVGSLTAPTSTTVEGQEGNGVIVFNGSLSSLTWTVPQGEYWHGFTFGTAGQPVPEPASLAVLGMGALALVKRRRK